MEETQTPTPQKDESAALGNEVGEEAPSSASAPRPQSGRVPVVLQPRIPQQQGVTLFGAIVLSLAGLAFLKWLFD